MLPQVNTIATTPTTILDIPSKTYKLNIDSEASAPYVIDNKNMVYFKLNDGRDDYIKTNSLLTVKDLNYTNLAITNNVKVSIEFTLTMTTGILLRLFFTDILGDMFVFKVSNSGWVLEYQQEGASEPITYTYTDTIKTDIRYTMDIYLANGKLIVNVNNKKIFEQPYIVTVSNPFAILKIYAVYAYKLHNVSIYNLDINKYLLNAIPYKNVARWSF